MSGMPIIKKKMITLIVSIIPCREQNEDKIVFQKIRGAESPPDL
jgi:hypothetical protein